MSRRLHKIALLFINMTFKPALVIIDLQEDFCPPVRSKPQMAISARYTLLRRTVLWPLEEGGR